MSENKHFCRKIKDYKKKNKSLIKSKSRILKNKKYTVNICCVIFLYCLEIGKRKHYTKCDWRRESRGLCDTRTARQSRRWLIESACVGRITVQTLYEVTDMIPLEYDLKFNQAAFYKRNIILLYIFSIWIHSPVLQA